MKYIFYGMFYMVIFQITCPSQDNAQSVMQNFNDDAQTHENSASVLDQSDGMSPDCGALRHNKLATFNFQRDDKASLERHNTFYDLDREISSLNRKMSQFRHYKDGNIEVAQKKFTPEFKVLCDKVRSFQSETGSEEIDSVSLKTFNSSLVGALLEIARQQELPVDSIPIPKELPLGIILTPIHSLVRCNASVSKTDADASAQSNKTGRNGFFGKSLNSVDSGTKAFLQPIDLIPLKAQSNKFPDIPMVRIVDKNDSDLETCEDIDSLGVSLNSLDDL